LGHALDRGEVPALGLDGEHGAALDGLAVDEDGAGATLAGVAADMGAGGARFVADVMHEQEPRLDLVLMPAAVDRRGDLMLHLRPPSSRKGSLARRSGCKSCEFRADYSPIFRPEMQLENSFSVAAPPDRVF